MNLKIELYNQLPDIIGVNNMKLFQEAWHKLPRE